jgi:hypothetical protein
MHKAKSILFNGALVIAIMVAMSGWMYALGWVALKLFKFV